MKTTLALALLLTACCPSVTPAPDAGTTDCNQPDVDWNVCEYRPDNPHICATPDGLPGWCTNYHTVGPHGEIGNAASCNLQCGSRGDCPPGWAPQIIDAVCICGET